MKTNRLILTVVTLVMAAEVGLGTVRGATNDVSGLLQKGLFEEEANHNLDAAIQAYEGVVTQTEKNRQFAATAVFRLGECYRKQGKTNEANAQYQKILRDFPDQAELAKLSRQQLGSAAEPAEGGDGADGLLARLQKRRADELESKPLTDIKKLSPEKRRVAVQQMFPNPVLNSLMQKMTETEQNLAKLKSTLGDNHPDVTAKTAVLKSIYQQIDDQVDAALSGRSKNADATIPGFSFEGAKEANEVKQIQAIINDSPDRINARGDMGSMGRTPLCQAVKDNHLKTVEFLLQNKADTEIPDNFAKTPLIIAAEAGRGEMVKLLLEHGADANAPVRKEKVAPNYGINKGDDGLTALHYAAFYGYKGVAEALLAHGANMEARNEENKTPLHMAAAKGFKSVAELLLAHKANVEAQRDTGATALHEAAYGGNKAIVELLIANHANVNARDSKGTTALFMTADTGYPAIAELLIAQGADLNLDQQGMTPLMEAIAQNRTDVAKLLIQHGADVKKARPIDNGQGWSGATALSMALEKSQTEIARSLLGKGADVDSVAYFWSLVDFRTPNAGSHHYGTPLMLAVNKNDREAIQLLLEHKANVSFSNTNGETPLLVAVQGGHKELVELLLDHNADVNAVDARGWSLLHHAVGNGQMDMAGLLLDRGVKVNIENYSGDTAIDLVNPHEKGPYSLAAVFSPSPFMPPPPRQIRASKEVLNPEDRTAAMLALLRTHGAMEPKIGDLEIISARLDAPNKSLNITDEVRKLLSSEDSRFLAQSGSIKAGNVLVPGLKEDPAQGMLVSIDYKFRGKLAEVVVSQPENLVTFWRLVDEAKRQNAKKP